jgi:hypothetical protein
VRIVDRDTQSRKQCFRVLQEALSSSGQRGRPSPRRSLDKLDANGVFKARDLLTNSRLRVPETRRRPSE